MKSILTLFCIGMISVFGSVSCAPDKEVAPTPEKLSSPVLVSETQTVPLEDLSSHSDLEWSLSDRLDFPSTGSFHRLEIISNCSIENKERFEAAENHPLHSRKLFQFLPEELLFKLNEKNPDTKALCSIDFKATSTSGSTHHFSIRQITVKAPEVFEIETSENPATVDLTSFNSEGGVLECEGATVNGRNEIEVKNAALPAQWCRRVEKDGSGEIAKVSRMQKVRLASEEIESQWKIRSRSDLPTGNTPETGAYYRSLTEGSGIPIGVLIFTNRTPFIQKTKLPNGIPVDLYALKTRENHYPDCNLQKAYYLFHTESSDEIQVPPNSSMTIKYVLQLNGKYGVAMPPYLIRFPQAAGEHLETLPERIYWTSLKNISDLQPFCPGT